MNVAIYTCITNRYDIISTPAVITIGVDYLCFNDGSIVVPEPWQDVRIDYKYTGKDANRYIKILPHLNKRLISYDLLIYIDGAIEITGDILALIQKVKLLEGHTFMYEHPIRNCVYVEAISCLKNMQAPIAETSRLLQRYRKDGMPEAFGLFEAGIIIRKVDSGFERLMEAWWKSYLNGVGRDQIALMYATWVTGESIHSLGRADHRFERKFFSCKSGHHRDLIKRYFIWWIWRPLIDKLIKSKIIKI